MNQGRCPTQTGLATSDLSACGQQQNMNHVVNLCSLTKFVGGIQPLHKAGDDAIHVMEYMTATALAK